ncbi:MAG: hypothetical protein V8S74_07755 [Lachnospirales bacterium]
MNKILSKSISFVLATVMTLSCFICNSIEVFADQTTQVWTPDSSQTWATFNDFTSATTGGTELATFDETIFTNATGGTTGKTNRQTANKSDSTSSTLAIKTTKENATLKIYATRLSSSESSSIASVVGTNGGIATTTDTTIYGGTSSKTDIAPIEYTFDKADTYTFSFTDASIGIFRLTLTDEFTIDTTDTFDCNVTVVNNTSNDVYIMDKGSSSTINASIGTNTYTFEGLDATVDHFLGFSTDDEANKYNLKDDSGNTNINIKGVNAITVYVTDKYFNAIIKVANYTDNDIEIKLSGNNTTTTQTASANTQLTEYTFTNLQILNMTDSEIEYTVYINNVSVGTVKYSNAVFSYDVTTTTESTTETTTEETSEETTIDMSNAVVVYNGDTVVGSYTKLNDALSDNSTVNGCVIKLKSGKYNEKVVVNKSVTITKEDNDDGEIIIYSSETDDQFNYVVYINADDVNISNITILNNIDCDSYEGIDAVDNTSKNTNTCALQINGNNGTYSNLKLIGSQDTLVVSPATSDNTNTFENCTIIGSTDTICGGGTATFNNCELIFDSGNRDKDTGFMFSPVYNANWTVNNAYIWCRESSIYKCYYGRYWLSSAYTGDKNPPTLNMYNTKVANSVRIGSEGILGFNGTTGMGTADGTGPSSSKNNGKLLTCKFYVYDISNNLIATTDVSKLNGLIGMNETKFIKFKDNNRALLIADYGIADNQTLTDNTLNDASSYGFVIFANEANATADNAKTRITDGTAGEDYIMSTTVFGNIATESSSKNGLEKELVESETGQYFGVGVIEGLKSTNDTVWIIPYVALDTSYKRNETFDTDPTYIFGEATEINLDFNSNN